jgi:tetratricopeptide (TPR) repeat protein
MVIHHYQPLYKIFPAKQKIAERLAFAHFQIGKNFEEEKRYPEALESATTAYQILAKNRYRNMMAQMHIEMGLLDFAFDKWDGALSNFQKAKELKSQKAEWYYIKTLLYKYFAEKFWPALGITVALCLTILIILTTFLRIRKRNLLAGLEKQAKNAFENRRWAETLQFYGQFRQIAKKGSPLEVLERMAICYTELGEYNNALQTYEKAKESTQGENLYIIEKGRIFAVKGNAELTGQLLRESSNLSEESQYLLDFCKELIQSESSLSKKNRFREVIGAIHLVRGERSTAKTIFEDLHHDNPRALYPIRKLIDIAKEEDEPKALKTYLEEYLEIDQENSSVIHDLGEYYESIGRKKEALDRYAEAYEITPLDRIRNSIRRLAKEFAQQLENPEADTVGVASVETLQNIIETLMKVKDYETSLLILQNLQNAGLSEPWIMRCMGDCFNAQMIDDMAIKSYRRYIDQYRKDQSGDILDEECKLVTYQLAKVYERKGFTELSLKEYQTIYEQDIKYKDIAIKIPVLYEKKMREEQMVEEGGVRKVPVQPISRPQSGEVRCPKCLNIIPDETVFCAFCNCKVGFTESELANQAARRKARLGDDPMLGLPAGPSKDNPSESDPNSDKN